MRLLITAGPTQEPIDEVRYIGNRSSGRMGMALAQEGAARGHAVTLLLGPVPAGPPAELGSGMTGTGTQISVERFRTTDDLDGLLRSHAANADVVVMGAAVADYRPKGGSAAGKMRRANHALTLELEPTPDLLAGIASRRRPGQLLVGFALEPRERLEASAREKLARKSIDLIVANELETMDSDRIAARVLGRGGEDFSTNGRIAKTEFAGWLLDIVERAFARR